MEQNPDVFDRTSALAGVGEDQKFLSEVAGLFQAAWPTLLADIREGLAAGDLRAVERNAQLARAWSAHLARASTSNVSARKVVESAHRLEITAHEGALEASRAACASLEHEVKKLELLLATVRDPKRL